VHDFAIVLMLGLALFKLVDLIEDYVPALTKFHALVSTAIAVAGMWFMDYSLFRSYDIGLREDWMGTVLTGLMVVGMTSVWRAAFHWFGTSEGDEPEVRHHLKAA
jgi:hypothetical protein